MTSPSSPEGSGLIERLKAVAQAQAHDDGYPLEQHAAWEAASALSAYEGRLEEARAALEPFARIKPSSLYPADGSEAEAYAVLLRGAYSNPLAFTGADLARARAALEQSGEGLGASVADRAGEGLRPFASDNQQILGKED